jgi:DEAD/DEAH box helicase domain-containing protein
LIEACIDKEDPVELVQQAAHDHIPANPGKRNTGKSDPIPDVMSRLPMPEVIETLKAEDWYRDQIVDHRSFEKKDPDLGKNIPSPTS